MKKICVALLCAGIIAGLAHNANAVDFKAKGEWLMGFALEDTDLIKKRHIGNVKTRNSRDRFHAAQRVRLQLDAVASEALSGSVQIQVGNQRWGQEESGASFGGNGYEARLRRAYLDWMAPETNVRVRMGLQGVVSPNAAGGSAIMDATAAAINANYQINDNIGVTALWARPLNDNFNGGGKPTEKDFLDNIDLFSLMLPITLDGFEITPWAMYGIKGKNSMRGIEGFQGFENGFSTQDGNLPFSLYPYPEITGREPGNGYAGIGGTTKTYASMFWAGLPFTISAFDPINVEVDLNYGYVEEMGRFWAYKNLSHAAGPWSGQRKRASTEREGWLAKALIEYKLDWCAPGIFGWYGSGDDANPANGSERMPSLVPMGSFTSFLGDGNMGWIWNDYALDYAGTWGIGLQVRDMKFIEDMSHTFRVAWWGGTNSTGMARYMNTPMSWAAGWASGASPYLTTSDGLLEFNFVSNYSMYENLAVNLEFGYVVNYIDQGTWKKANIRNAGFSKQDAWKAQLVFAYSF